MEKRKKLLTSVEIGNVNEKLSPWGELGCRTPASSPWVTQAPALGVGSKGKSKVSPFCSSLQWDQTWCHARGMQRSLLCHGLCQASHSFPLGNRSSRFQSPKQRRQGRNTLCFLGLEAKQRCLETYIVCPQGPLLCRMVFIYF